MTNITKGIELAKAASPGPWEVNSDHFMVCSTGCSNEDGNDYQVCMNGYAARDGADSDAKSDAEFIAHHNPAYMLSLYEYIEKMQKQKELDRLEIESLRIINVDMNEELHELRRDKARLEWMIGPYGRFLYRSSSKFSGNLTGDEYWYWGVNGKHYPTPREAIDAEMEQEKKA